MTNSINTSAITGKAMVVGAAAFMVGSVPPITAAIVGGTFALVSQVTKPFFREDGILSFIFNVAATTSMVNLLSKHSLTFGNTAYTTFLPILAILKIITFAGLIIGAGLLANAAYGKV